MSYKTMSASVSYPFPKRNTQKTAILPSYFTGLTWGFHETLWKGRRVSLKSRNERDISEQNADLWIVPSDHEPVPQFTEEHSICCSALKMWAVSWEVTTTVSFADEDLWLRLLCLLHPLRLWQMWTLSSGLQKLKMLWLCPAISYRPPSLSLLAQIWRYLSHLTSTHSCDIFVHCYIDLREEKNTSTRKYILQRYFILPSRGAGISL